MANCDIIVNVNVNGLSQDNITSKVTLTDCNNDKDKKPGDSSTFDTKVNGNTNITWKPESGDGVDTINITKIEVTSTENVFSSGPGAPDNHGWVSAKVKSNSTSQPISSEYTIYFKVNNQGTEFHLDPKMEVNPNT